MEFAKKTRYEINFFYKQEENNTLIGRILGISFTYSSRLILDIAEAVDSPGHPQDSAVCCHSAVIVRSTFAHQNFCGEERMFSVPKRELSSKIDFYLQIAIHGRVLVSLVKTRDL